MLSGKLTVYGSAYIAGFEFRKVKNIAALDHFFHKGQGSGDHRTGETTNPHSGPRITDACDTLFSQNKFCNHLKSIHYKGGKNVHRNRKTDYPQLGTRRRRVLYRDGRRRQSTGYFRGLYKLQGMDGVLDSGGAVSGPQRRPLRRIPGLRRHGKTERRRAGQRGLLLL